VITNLTFDELVRLFDCSTEGRPQDFDQVVARDHLRRSSGPYRVLLAFSVFNARPPHPAAPRVCG
jgi:hypothetical protein